MDLTQRLLGILNVYKDNSELISTAVKDVHLVGSEVTSVLRMGLENRRRKLILKAIALLAPSDIPAKVVEVDGVDDAELLILRDMGHLEEALAIYFRHDSVSQALFNACALEFDEGTAFYAYSIYAAAWDCVELGENLRYLASSPSCDAFRSWNGAPRIVFRMRSERIVQLRAWGTYGPDRCEFFFFSRGLGYKRNSSTFFLSLSLSGPATQSEKR